MGYEQGAIGGTPVFLGGSNNGGLLGGGGEGGLGGLLLGGLLFGQGGLGGMFGGNRGMMNGMGMGANGYYGGNVQGEQTAGITSLQGQLTALSSTVNSNQVANQMGQISDSIGDGIGDINTNINSISRDLIAGQGNLNNAITNSGFATLTNINGAVRDFTSQNNNIALQQLNSANILANQINTGFNSINATNVQGFNEIGRDMNHATSQLIAQGNAMAAQAAACCCDLKQAICVDGGLTRALINDIRISELNGQLTDAKLSNSNLMQTNALTANNAMQTNVILQHIAPLLACNGGDRRTA